MAHVVMGESETVTPEQVPSLGRHPRGCQWLSALQRPRLILSPVPQALATLALLGHSCPGAASDLTPP